MRKVLIPGQISSLSINKLIEWGDVANAPIATEKSESPNTLAITEDGVFMGPDLIGSVVEQPEPTGFNSVPYISSLNGVVWSYTHSFVASPEGVFVINNTNKVVTPTLCELDNELNLTTVCLRSHSIIKLRVRRDTIGSNGPSITLRYSLINGSVNVPVSPLVKLSNPGVGTYENIYYILDNYESATFGPTSVLQFYVDCRNAGSVSLIDYQIVKLYTQPI